MTEFLEVEGGTDRLRGDRRRAAGRAAARHGRSAATSTGSLAPQLVAAGYRVAAADLRGHGESSTGWAVLHPHRYRRATLLALIRHLGGPAVIVGHSFSGGSATIAAAQAPDLVSAIVEIGPFTRVPKISLGALLRNRRYRQGHAPAARHRRSPAAWARGRATSIMAFPGLKPADYERADQPRCRRNLREPGRMAATRKMGKSRPADAERQARPASGAPPWSIMGTLDPDWPDPRAEGGRDRGRDAGRARPRA